MIVNSIFLAVVYMMEPFIWLKSMSQMGWKSEKIKKFSWLFWAGYYVITLVKQYFVLDANNETINTVFSILVNIFVIGVPFYIFSGTFVKKIYNVGLFIVSNCLSEILTFVLSVIILQVPASIVFAFGLANIFCTLISKILLCGFCYLFFYSSRKELVNTLYINKELLPLIIANIIFEIIVFNIFPYSKLIHATMEILVIFLFSQTMLLSTLFYITYLLRKVKAELEQKKQIIELTNKLEDLRHDMSFHIKMIKALGEKEKYKDMMEYINDAFLDVEVAEDTFTLENYPVSVVLSSVAKEAREKHIKFTHAIMIQDFILPNHEICSVLSNILKNAMEAAEKVENEKGFICLEIAPNRTGYYINCINAYKDKTEEEAGKLITLKDDKTSHGRGLGIVQGIVKKNNGMYTTKFEENYFEIDCKIIRKER